MCILVTNQAAAASSSSSTSPALESLCLPLLTLHCLETFTRVSKAQRRCAPQGWLSRELCVPGAASRRPPTDSSRRQALPLVSRPLGSCRGMGGLQPPIRVPILRSCILHLPSRAWRKVWATPARTTPWGLCCMAVAAGAVRGGEGRSTGVGVQSTSDGQCRRWGSVNRQR